jgi:hypothetical protein
MNLYVYLNNTLIVIESNLAFAVPYWAARKRLVKGIRTAVKLRPADQIKE